MCRRAYPTARVAPERGCATNPRRRHETYGVIDCPPYASPRRAREIGWCLRTGWYDRPVNTHPNSSNPVSLTVSSQRPAGTAGPLPHTIAIVAMPALLTTADIAGRYGLKDHAAARRIMHEVGAISAGGRLLVRADRLDVWETSAHAPAPSGVESAAAGRGSRSPAPTHIHGGGRSRSPEARRQLSGRPRGASTQGRPW